MSPFQLSELGVSLVELGHAERRRSPFNETDELVARKAVGAMRAGLVPLVCVGEKSKPGTGMVSEGVGRAVGEVWRQCEAVIGGMEEEMVRLGEGGKGEVVVEWEGESLTSTGRERGRLDVIFAYEPVWAIGAEEPAGADHVCAVVGEIKRRVGERWKGKGLEGRGEVRVLYGGSAGPGTWEGLKGVCDGLFLGRFAHRVENVGVVVGEMLEGVS